MNTTLASFAEPWRKLPKILMFYVTCGVIGAALLTFLHVRFPPESAALPKPIPIEAPNSRTDFPPTVMSKIINIQQKIVDTDTELQRNFTRLTQLISERNKLRLEYLSSGAGNTELMQAVLRDENELEALRSAQARRDYVWAAEAEFVSNLGYSRRTTEIIFALTWGFATFGAVSAGYKIFRSLLRAFAVIQSRRNALRRSNSVARAKP